MTQISKILIANRGEIACRVIRTARSLGIATVAVYSDADANAKHVRMADESVHIGASEVGQSYLVIEKIIEAAKATGANGIHPGYGFLSENAAFSQSCAANDIVFIGPGEKAIKVMGDKARSKRAMLEAGVPCIPGYQDEDQSDDTLIGAASKIGVPVMVKAAAGGGGRGMRLVHDEAELANAIKLARSEAESAFGSGDLIIEKAVQQPRHVEVQVFADKHGNVIHLGERDCSVQRRHQKVIEEAPCPVMTPALREEMGAAAVAAARAVDYCGAGTVEFLLDKDGAFYFLEMNTRLQVEHPVTEQITGLDLVAMQIAVAEGNELPLSQDQVELSGHSIEVRLYAEDPANDFMPSTGPVLLWNAPQGKGIRVDDGIETGDQVSPFYDAMVAKIIATGETREQALKRLKAAVGSTVLLGLPTNRDFLIDAMNRESFAKGEATTAFIAEQYGDEGFTSADVDTAKVAMAIALHFDAKQILGAGRSLAVHPELMEWSSTQDLEYYAEFQAGEEPFTARIIKSSPAKLTVSIGEVHTEVEIVRNDGGAAAMRVGGQFCNVTYFIDDNGRIHLASEKDVWTLQDLSNTVQSSEDEGGGGMVRAPMHGKLLEISVSVGDTVAKGQGLGTLEAMKMQHEIIAEVDGTVEQIAGTVGEQIGMDELILEIAVSEGEEK